MIHGIINKLSYLKEIYDRREECLLFSKGHQVKLYNWSKPVPYDMWLIDFIEKRDLLKNKPDLRVGLYSIFAPSWTMMFDRCDMRVFVERENSNNKFAEFLYCHLLQKLCNKSLI